MTSANRSERAYRKALKEARRFAPKPERSYVQTTTPATKLTHSAAKNFGSHTSVHSPALKRVLNVIMGLPSVDRIIIGQSKGTRHSRPVGAIKLQGIAPNGVRMVGYGDRGIMSFFVVTSNPEAAQQEITRKFGL